MGYYCPDCGVRYSFGRHETRSGECVVSEILGVILEQSLDVQQAVLRDLKEALADEDDCSDDDG